MFQKKGVGTRRLKYLAAPPSNLTGLYYNGSAAKSHSTTTQYRQLRRLTSVLPDFGFSDRFIRGIEIHAKTSLPKV